MTRSHCALHLGMICGLGDNPDIERATGRYQHWKLSWSSCMGPAPWVLLQHGLMSETSSLVRTQDISSAGSLCSVHQKLLSSLLDEKRRTSTNGTKPSIPCKTNKPCLGDRDASWLLRNRWCPCGCSMPWLQKVSPAWCPRFCETRLDFGDARAQVPGR